MFLYRTGNQFCSSRVTWKQTSQSYREEKEVLKALRQQELTAENKVYYSENEAVSSIINQESFFGNDTMDIICFLVWCVFLALRLNIGRPLYVFVFTKRIYEGYE